MVENSNLTKFEILPVETPSGISTSLNLVERPIGVSAKIYFVQSLISVLFEQVKLLKTLLELMIKLKFQVCQNM